MTKPDLLAQFIEAFGKLGEMVVFAADSVPSQLDDGFDDSPWATPKWKPAAIATDPAALLDIYAKLPGHFPPLYEQLVLSYRWLEIDLNGLLTLLGNPPGPALEHLLSQITCDPIFVKVLFLQGLIPFGKATGDNYDPICFDTARRNAATGDCPVVRIDHEAVLCHDRIVKHEMADSFQTLVESVVAAANFQAERTKI